jgi:hypothetical protein
VTAGGEHQERVEALVRATWPGARVVGRARLQERREGGRGRAVDRLVLVGPRGVPRTAVLKWRDDRPVDREAVLYAQVLDPALAAPRRWACSSADGVHFLLLEDVPGEPLDPEDPAALAAAFRALGLAHARSWARLQAWWAGRPGALIRAGAADVGAVAAELRLPPEGAGAEPWVLDQGDLRPENALVARAAGRAWWVDYENLAARPQGVALAPVREAGQGWPRGTWALAEAAYRLGWAEGGGRAG